MIVEDAIELLKKSELKALAMKDDVPAILGAINLGILEIYKRFLLWEGEATITQATGVDTYTLDDIDTNVDIDLTDHELLLIEKVYDEENLPYVINNEKSSIHIIRDEENQGSIFTPRFNQIKVTTIIPGYVMTVKYRAAPKFLTAITDSIPLPQQFLEALFLYVGYKGQLSVKANVKDENNAHYMRFEASCDRISLEGLNIQPDMESTKFESRGFV